MSGAWTALVSAIATMVAVACGTSNEDDRALARLDPQETAVAVVSTTTHLENPTSTVSITAVSSTISKSTTSTTASPPTTTTTASVTTTTLDERQFAEAQIVMSAYVLEVTSDLEKMTDASETLDLDLLRSRAADALRRMDEADEGIFAAQQTTFDHDWDLADAWESHHFSYIGVLTELEASGQFPSKEALEEQHTGLWLKLLALVSAAA